MDNLLGSLKFSQRRKEDAILLAGLSIATLSIVYSAYKRHQSAKSINKVDRGLKQIPTPSPSLPLFGHMLSIGADANKQFMKWHDELGPIFQIKMGRQTWIIIADKDLAQKVFVTHGAETAFRPYSTYGYVYYSFEGFGIGFAQPGHHWNKNRAAALTVLAPKNINNFEDAIVHETQYLVDMLLETSLEKGSVDPMKHFELASTNIIYSTCFGSRFTSVTDPKFYALAEMNKENMVLAGFQNDLPNFLPFLSFVDKLMGVQAKMRHHIDSKRDPAYRQLIKEARAMEGPNLVKSIDESQFDMTDDELLVFTSDFILAATDTTSVTLAWSFAILCYYSDVRQKLIQELDAFISAHGRIPSFQERNDIPYTVAVMRECMRYRSMTPIGVPHSVDQDVVVDGYLLPKGCTLVSSTGSMHMNPNYYADPKVFKPERFLNNNKTMMAAANGRLNDRDHFAFGWGRRICPGIYLAEMEIFYVFVQIFARADILPDMTLPDIDGVLAAGLTFTPNPYTLKFVARPNALV
ncbi:hypothetical protein MBANPS3_007016 [Mucor bainieri]